MGYSAKKLFYYTYNYLYKNNVFYNKIKYRKMSNYSVKNLIQEYYIV